MQPRFNVLTLGVANLENSFKFYHEGLGFPSQGITGREYEHGEVAFLDLKNGMKLALHSRSNLAWDSRLKEGSPSPAEFSIGHLVGSEKEVDTILQLAKHAGAHIAKPAEKTF